MGKKLVLIGGGHAHMVTMANVEAFLLKGHEVTVIGSSECHYYSGMGPGMLGTTYSPDDIRFTTRADVENKGGIFLLDTVTKLDPNQKTIFLASGKTVNYDVVSCNAGSYVPYTCVSKNTGDIFSVKPIETLLAARKRILELTGSQKATITIVGGGPSSAEIAGNILQLVKKRGSIVPEIHIYSGHFFMERFPSKIQNLVRSSLSKRGIKIHEGSRVSDVQTGSITLETGETISTDLIFLALGVRPSEIFQKSGLPVGPKGGLLVNQFLQSPQHPEIFGGGDCIHFQPQPLDKVGVYAVRQNPILFHNLLAALNNEPLQPFDPGGNYLLIFNLGEDYGVLRKGWVTFGGHFAFWIKDYIDRKFMRKFQSY